MRAERVLAEALATDQRNVSTSQIYHAWRQEAQRPAPTLVRALGQADRSS